MATEIAGLADLKAEFLRSIGYVGGLIDMETLYYEDVSGLVKVGYYDAIRKALSDLGCTQKSVYDQLVCKYGTAVANLSPSQLEREALEAGTWGANYVGEVARFDPDQNAGATFWTAINGKTDRTPDTGRASQGDGVADYWDGGNILANIGTGGSIIYFNFIVGTVGNTQAIGGNGFFAGASGHGMGTNTSSKITYNIRDVANVSIDSDSVIVGGQKMSGVMYRSLAGAVSMFLGTNTPVLTKQTDTDTMTDDITADEDFLLMARETSGTPGFFSDHKLLAFAVVLGVPDLTDAQLASIRSPYDLRNLPFTDRAGWVFTEGASDEAIDIFKLHDLSGTGHLPAWITANTLRSFKNEVGFGTSSDKASVDIPISFDLKTLAYTPNQTAIFLGKVALRVEFAVTPVVDSDGLKTDGGQSITDPDSSPELSQVTFPLVLNLDNQFSYGDVSVANRLAILIMFSRDTQAGDYPAGERDIILLFIND